MPKTNKKSDAHRPRAQGGRWRVGWTDRAGRQRWKSFGGLDRVSQAEALRRYRAWLAGRPVARVISETLGPFEDWARTWYRRVDRTESSEASGILSAVRPFVAMFGRRMPATLTVADLESYRTALVDRGLSRSTVNAYTYRVRRFGAWLVRSGYSSSELVAAWGTLPALRSGRTSAPEAGRGELAPAASVAAVRAILEQPWADLLALQILTAARPGELIGAKIKDVDRSASVWWLVVEAHKTAHRGHERQLAMGKKAQAILGRWLTRGAAAWLFTLAGRPVTPDRYRRAILAACVRAECAKFTPYQVRRLALSQFESRYGRVGSALVAGHSSPGVTEHYVDRRASDRDRLAAIAEGAG